MWTPCSPIVWTQNAKPYKDKDVGHLEGQKPLGTFTAFTRLTWEVWLKWCLKGSAVPQIFLCYPSTVLD